MAWDFDVHLHPARWYYLVDIIDGYSIFMMNWSLNLTIKSDTVTMTVQEALEKLDTRRAGEPRIVHDQGSQFISREWRSFVEGAEIIDIRIRIAHPELNGRLERLHRTHGEEGLTGEALTGYYSALDAMERWDDYYNYKRPHSAICYFVPADYYRGNPDDRIAEQKEKLVQAGSHYMLLAIACIFEGRTINFSLVENKLGNIAQEQRKALILLSL
jgi:transposase InsO family protein